MTHIAFLGIGRMGAAMASRLLDAGHTLTIWNRTPAATAPLTALGATAAATPAAAVAGAPVVITMLRDSAAVTDVLFGGGAAAGLVDHALLIEMSTIGPAAVAQVRHRLPATVRMVDAPVKGSVPAAQAGELDIYLGGASPDVDDCGDLLAALGKVRHVGPLGSAAALKLVLNAVGMSSLVLLAEALRVADRLGVPTELALDELAPVNPAAVRLRKRLAHPEAPVHFTVALARKDLDLALQAAAAERGADVSAAAQDRLAAGVIAGARDQLAAAGDAGYGPRDITSVVDYLRGNHH